MTARLRYTSCGNLVRVSFSRPAPPLDHGGPRRNLRPLSTAGQILVWVCAWVLAVGPWVALGFLIASLLSCSAPSDRPLGAAPAPSPREGAGALLVAPSRNPPGDNPSNGRAKAALADGTPSAASPHPSPGQVASVPATRAGAEMGTTPPVVGRETGTLLLLAEADCPRSFVVLCREGAFTDCACYPPNLGRHPIARPE